MKWERQVMSASIAGIVGSILLVMGTATQAHPSAQLKAIKVVDLACLAAPLPIECSSSGEDTPNCKAKMCIKIVPVLEDVVQALNDLKKLNEEAIQARNDLKKLIQEAEVRARRREQAMCKALGHSAAECDAAVPKAD